METRKLLASSVLVGGLSVALLAQRAEAAESLMVAPPVAVEVAVDQQLFRRDIDAYIRALNEQLRETLDRDLRRELAPRIELASSEVRARG